MDRETCLQKSERLLSEAIEIMNAAEIRDYEYVSTKPVKKACKAAWDAVSQALNEHLGIQHNDTRRKWIGWDESKLRFEDLDKKLYALVCEVYFYLYIDGYRHSDIAPPKLINKGFTSAQKVLAELHKMAVGQGQPERLTDTGKPDPNE